MDPFVRRCKHRIQVAMRITLVNTTCLIWQNPIWKDHTWSACPKMEDDPTFPLNTYHVWQNFDRRAEGHSGYIY